LFQTKPPYIISCAPCRAGSGASRDGIRHRHFLGSSTA